VQGEEGSFQLAVSEPVSDVSSAIVASAAPVQATQTLIVECHSPPLRKCNGIFLSASHEG
jgi:hypothetical protein